MGACRLALALLAAALAATAASTPLVVSSPTLSLSLGAHAAALAEAAAAGAAAPSAGGSVSLSLAPSVVDFGAMPVSTLGSATLRLRNTALRRNLTVLAVLADERRFYLREQPFAARTLVPGEQFALELLFLPHAPGAARGTLLVRTSEGTVAAALAGVGLASAHELQPIATPSAGRSMRRSVTMYNPGDSPVKVLEVSTDEDALQLTLPGGLRGDGPHPRELWALAPGQRKEIIQLQVLSRDRLEQRRGFVNIRTENGTFVVPVDVSMVKDTLTPVAKSLVFGVLTGAGSSKTLDLRVLNAFSHPLLVSVDAHLSSWSQRGARLLLHYDAMSRFRGGEEGTAVFVTLSTENVTADFDASGEIVLRAFDPTLYGTLQAAGKMVREVRVPWSAAVRLGSLEADWPATRFMAALDANKPVTQKIAVANRFASAVEIFSASIRPVGAFLPPQLIRSTIGAGLQEKVLSVTFDPRLLKTGLPGRATLELMTNTSSLQIQLLAVAGLLSPSHLTVDFGVVPSSRSRTRVVNMSNPFDHSVSLHMWAVGGRKSTGELGGALSIELGAIWTANGTAVLDADQERVANKKNHELAQRRSGKASRAIIVSLPALGTALFATTLLASGSEDVTVSERVAVFASPTMPEGKRPASKLIIPTTLKLRYSTLAGSLTFPSIEFSTTLAGQKSISYLRSGNLYSRPVAITGVTSSDPRFSVRLKRNAIPVARGKGKTIKIGRVIFNGADVGSMDGSSTEISATLSVHTNVSTETVPIKASLLRVSMFRLTELAFNITQAGCAADQWLEVQNPFEAPISIRFLGFEDKPARVFDAAMLLSNRSSRECFGEECTGGAFRLQGDEQVLGPKGVGRLGPITFSPGGIQAFNATLYVSSNVTNAFAINVSGVGAAPGRLTFVQSSSAKRAGALVVPLPGSRAPQAKKFMNVTEALKVQVKSKELREMISSGRWRSEQESSDAVSGRATAVFSRYYASRVHIDRNFTVRNTGSMPVVVHSMAVLVPVFAGTWFEVMATSNGKTLGGTNGKIAMPAGAELDVMVRLSANFKTGLASSTLVVDTAAGPLLFPISADLPLSMVNNVVAHLDSKPSGISPIRNALLLCLVTCVAIAMGQSHREVITTAAAKTMDSLKGLLLESVNQPSSDAAVVTNATGGDRSSAKAKAGTSSTLAEARADHERAKEAAKRKAAAAVKASAEASAASERKRVELMMEEEEAAAQRKAAAAAQLKAARKKSKAPVLPPAAAAPVPAAPVNKSAPALPSKKQASQPQKKAVRLEKPVPQTQLLRPRVQAQAQAKPQLNKPQLTKPAAKQAKPQLTKQAQKQPAAHAKSAEPVKTAKAAKPVKTAPRPAGQRAAPKLPTASAAKPALEVELPPQVDPWASGGALDMHTPDAGFNTFGLGGLLDGSSSSFGSPGMPPPGQPEQWGVFGSPGSASPSKPATSRFFAENDASANPRESDRGRSRFAGELFGASDTDTVGTDEVGGSFGGGGAASNYTLFGGAAPAPAPAPDPFSVGPSSPFSSDLSAMAGAFAMPHGEGAERNNGGERVSSPSPEWLDY